MSTRLRSPPPVEEDQLLGAAGRARGARQRLAAGERVDQARLADIGAAGEGDLDAARARQRGLRAGGGGELPVAGEQPAPGVDLAGGEVDISSCCPIRHPEERPVRSASRRMSPHGSRRRLRRLLRRVGHVGPSRSDAFRAGHLRVTDRGISRRREERREIEPRSSPRKRDPFSSRFAVPPPSSPHGEERRQGASRPMRPRREQACRAQSVGGCAFAGRQASGFGEYILCSLFVLFTFIG